MSYLRTRLIPYESGLQLLERAGVDPRGGRVRLVCDDRGQESYDLEFDCRAGTVRMHHFERVFVDSKGKFSASGIYGMGEVQRLYNVLYPLFDALFTNPRVLPQSPEVFPD